MIALSSRPLYGATVLYWGSVIICGSRRPNHANHCKQELHLLSFELGCDRGRLPKKHLTGGYLASV